MTTKPRAKKFRVRRSASRSPAAPREAAANAGPAEAATEGAQRPEELSVEQQIDTIRREGLTGRQLRMARRVAQRHGLAPTSDYDAVRLLRAKGVDPFKRANLLELVVAKGQDREGGEVRLPQTTDRNEQRLPSTELYDEDQRAREIRQIQRDIARRRRRKLAALILRLAFFVFLPTGVAGYYYGKVATPLYATHSEFVIQQADSLGGAGGLGGLFSGTQFATSQDSITVQSYLQSRDAMLRLDQDHGFKAHFSREDIDPVLRLPADATNEDAYDLYSDMVAISYDPTEGIIKMEVTAANPDLSAEFSRALIAYAEDIVDNLSQRLREDQMKGARESYREAEENMRAAQQRVIDLQERYNVISTDVEVQLLASRISTLEQQLTQEELTLEEMLANPRPNPARVDPLRRRIESLRDTIAELRAELTQGSAGEESLARIGSELQVAQADLETRNLMMQEALQQLETARIEANRQTRYLSTGVAPVPPDESTYPRAFENTVLAFLIFSGIYLMASLTASILREQVST